VSRSLISQIERDVAGPSIEVLRRLATSLEVPVSVFFESPSVAEDWKNPGNEIGDSGRTPSQDQVKVVHRDERFKLSLPKSSLQYEMCTPLSHRSIQAVWAVLVPGEAGPAEPFCHDGEEVVLVISGKLTAIVSDKEYLLEPGSTICYGSNQPHRLINRGSEPVIAYSVMVPAAY
jgi:mannose-6-phosphate isomerase-like protein (cupin superfamily)